MSDQKVFDEILDNALQVFRLAANQRSITLANLKKLEKELLAKFIVEDLTARQKAKLETFIKRTDKLIEKHFKSLQKELDLEGIAEVASFATVHAYEIAFGFEALNLPTKDYFKSVASNVLIEGSPAADWWRGQSEDLKFRFAGQVRQGLTNGENNQQIISRIIGKNGYPGIMETARRNAAALVQTSVQAVANDARRATFDANPDVIKGLRQVSTLDGRTSLTCVAYSNAAWDLNRKPILGTTLPFNGGCPRHFNCRSVEIPITKTFRELGLDMDEPTGTTRASADGQINVNTSFEDFLDRRGKAYQDQVLGKGRADLYRQGKITLRDLIYADGRPVSLEELKRKYAK